MIRKSKTTKKRQGWLGNARGSGGEAAKAHHKMRCVKKLVQEKGGKAKLPWWSLSEGRISVGVDVVSRGNHRAFSRKRTRTEEKVRTWSKSALRAKIRPYFEKNGTSHVLIGYLVAGGVSDGVFFGHVYLFSRYMRFFVRFLSRFSSRHPSVLVLRANRGDGEPRAHASKVERCDSLKDGSDGLFACSLRCVV